MTRSVELYVGQEERRVGALHYNKQGNRESTVLEYSSEWLQSPDSFSLSPALPLVSGPQYHKQSQGVPWSSVFHSVIADTEPDGWGRRVINRDHAKKRQLNKRAGESDLIPPLDSLDYLLSVDDIARVGAIRFRDESGTFQRSSAIDRRGCPPILDLSQLFYATRAIEMNAETEADLAYLRGRGTSLGGMRPKCTIIDTDNMLAIGKFPSVNDERAVTKGEVLALSLAAKAGINAAHARIEMSDNIPIAVIRRFDRTVSGGRYMYISAFTLLDAESDPSHEHCYTEIADMLRRYGVNPKEDLEELWRRIAFSILITNIDDHLRNHGFLHEQGGFWRLSPAFDLNPFPDKVRELKTWISEATGPAASIESLLSEASYFGITRARSLEILSDVLGAVEGWRSEGLALGMSQTELEPFEPAFEHEELTVARRITRAFSNLG